MYDGEQAFNINYIVFNNISRFLLIFTAIYCTYEIKQVSSDSDKIKPGLEHSLQL